MTRAHHVKRNDLFFSKGAMPIVVNHHAAATAATDKAAAAVLTIRPGETKALPINVDTKPASGPSRLPWILVYYSFDDRRIRFVKATGPGEHFYLGFDAPKPTPKHAPPITQHHPSSAAPLKFTNTGNGLLTVSTDIGALFSAHHS